MVNKSLWAAALLLIPTVHAQFLQQGPKLIGTDTAGNAAEGKSVAISADGNTAIVGGYFDNAGRGAAFVYVRANGVWTQQGPKLVGAGGSGTAGQGISIALSADGNTAIVGAPNDGAAWVFARTAGVWTQQGPRLSAPGTTQGGRSVSISGDGNTALVGGPGSAAIFTRTNGAWTLDSALPAPTGVGPDNPTFGWSAALSADGNTAIVGGPADTGNTGAAWVYTRTAPGAPWTQQGPKLKAADASSGAQQGISVALSADGSTALVGGFGDNNFAGAIWIYTRANGAWTQQGPKLTGTGAVGAADQGGAVSLSADGNTAIEGGFVDNQRIGAVWVFTRSGGVWTQQGAKLVGAGWNGAPPFSAPSQGTSVAISGDGHTLIEGGLDDQPYGAAWVFASAPVHFTVSAPATVVAGTPFTVTVTAFNPDNSAATSYNGTVHFSSNDPLALLPPDSPLANGAGTFTVTLKTGNSLSPVLTVTDITNQGITGASAPIGVQAAAASQFGFSALPGAVTSGASFSFIVTAYDRFGNFAPSNTARVHFTSTDPAAILPPDTQMPSGVGSFSAVLNTAGNQTLTVTDTANPAATGTSDPIAVSGGSTVTNLALRKTATQISTYRFTNAVASLAVDGNTDGNFYDGSVTATDVAVSPWWQVDLGASANVSSVVIWNRIDCCSSRLSDYWVFVSDTPFLPADSVTSLSHRAATFSSHQTAAPNPSISIPVNQQGRYVRVQIPETAVNPVLSLAEVQVLGTFVTSPGGNLAQGKTASQSSDFPGYPSDGAAAAVDGSTDGSFFNGSVTATNLDPNPWWQVDLGASATVNSVVLWNRTDCCGSRLADYWVFVSNTPFLATDTPATLATRANTFATHQTTAPDPSGVISIGGTVGYTGRYVRVQLSAAGILSLAEVQVMGTGGAPAPVNIAVGKTASQSTTLPGYPDGAYTAVDGNTDGNFYHQSVTATMQQLNPWWQVDLGDSLAIGSIAIWNRTDCCSERLRNYWVFVSDTPFLDTDTPTNLQTRAGTWSSFQANQPSPATTIPAGVRGRYVRVQLTDLNYLSLAEVQVYGQ